MIDSLLLNLFMTIKWVLIAITTIFLLIVFILIWQFNEYFFPYSAKIVYVKYEDNPKLIEAYYRYSNKDYKYIYYNLIPNIIREKAIKDVKFFEKLANKYFIEPYGELGSKQVNRPKGVWALKLIYKTPDSPLPENLYLTNMVIKKHNMQVVLITNLYKTVNLTFYAFNFIGLIQKGSEICLAGISMDTRYMVSPRGHPNDPNAVDVLSNNPFLLPYCLRPYMRPQYPNYLDGIYIQEGKLSDLQK